MLCSFSYLRICVNKSATPAGFSSSKQISVVLLPILAHLGQQVCNTIVFQKQAEGCIAVAVA